MKFLKSNWREVISLITFVNILILGIFALQSQQVSESGHASAAVSVIVQLLGATAKFVVCLGLAWAGLGITFPEANKFVVGREFDDWWNHLYVIKKGYVSLIAAGVIGLMAAICMAT